MSVTSNRFTALDSLRGIAAVGVVLFHIRTDASIAIVRQGWLFVDFFFVLSGFVIAAAYGERLANGFPKGTFLFLRLGRVYPLHIAMVGVFAVMLLAKTAQIEQGQVQFLRAVLLLDAYWPNADNYFNGVSWSISAELLAYVAAAFLFGSGKKGAAIVVIAMAVAAYGQLHWPDMMGFSGFVRRVIIGFPTGVACFWLYRRWQFNTAAEAVVLIAAVAAISLSGPQGGAVLLCVPVFAAVVVVFAQERGAFSQVLKLAPFTALGAWSYSIYMVHTFVLRSAAHVAGGIFGQTEGSGSELAGVNLSPVGITLLSLTVVGVTIALASQTYKWIEEPARRWAKARTAAERAAPTI